MSKGDLTGGLRETVVLDRNVFSLAFVPHSLNLLIGTDLPIVAYEIPEVGPVRFVSNSPLNECTGPCTMLAVSPNGQQVIVGTKSDSGAENFRVRELPSMKLRTLLRNSRVSPQRRGTAYLPDGRLVVYSVDQIQILDLDHVSLRVLPKQIFTKVKSLAFLPDGKSLVIGTTKPPGEIRTRTEIPPLPLLDKKIIDLDFLFKFNFSTTLRLWNVASSREENLLLPSEGSMAPPEIVRISRDGNLLAAGGLDGSVWIWNLPRRQRIDRLFLTDNTKSYAQLQDNLLAFHPVKAEYAEKSEGILSLAFSPDQRWLVGLGTKGTVTLWDTDTWQSRHLFQSSPVKPSWLGFRADSMLGIAYGGVVRICDPQTGNVLKTLGAENNPTITCAAFSSQGNTLVTATITQNLQIWSDLGSSPKTILTDHQGSITALTFHPDGKTFASGDRIGVIKLWNLATRREIAAFPGKGGIVNCLTFSPDGEMLVSGADLGTHNGDVSLWRAPRK